MSSPDIESPYSAYSQPSEVLTTQQPAIQRLPRASSDTRFPPQIRFRSPELFQHILGEPLPEDDIASRPAINYEETMNDVNRALLSANRAIQNAQEAFQSRRPLSASTNSQSLEVVDLTSNSPPLSNSRPPQSAAPASMADDPYDAFLSRITHPHDQRPRHSMMHGLINDSSYGADDFVNDSSEPRYSGPDSLASARRRFQNNAQLQYNISRATMLSHQRHSGTRSDAAAVRRQQQAHAQWEESQRRTNERMRLEQQRQRILSSPTQSRTTQTINRRSDFASQSQPMFASTSSSGSSTIEAVDLTQVDDEASLSAALSKQRQDAINSQNSSKQQKSSNSGITDGAGRTALTAYKCPICMEPPQNATTTACGHLFCHKCIIDTLKWSEQARRDEVPASRKVRGVCPVCRKELARKEEPGPGRTLIPLEIRLISKKELKRKREEEEQAKNVKRKGKEKVYDINELDDGDEDSFQHGGNPSQKENQDLKGERSNSNGYMHNEMDDLFDFGLHDFP